MAAQRIHRSPIELLPLPEPDTPVWETLSSLISDDRLSSEEPVLVDIERGVSRTLKEQLDRSEALARSLCAHRHLAKVRQATTVAELATVGILSPNVIDYITVVWACLAAAIPFAPMASSSTVSEAKNLFKLSHAKVLFVHPSLIHTAVEAGFPRQQIILIENQEGWRGDTVSKLVERAGAYPDFRIDGELPKSASGLCYILFSSGSTGTPKGVMTSHANLTAAIMQNASWLGAVMMAAAETGAAFVGSAVRPVILGFLPLYHLYGLMTYSIRLLVGECTICMLPKWETTKALEAIEKYKINALPLVPTIASELIASPHLVKRYDLSSLRAISSASSAIDAAQKTQLMDLLGSRGAFPGEVKEAKMMNAYGMSETTLSITSWPVEGMSCGGPRAGTLGVLAACCSARIVKPDWTDAEGVDVEEGQSGEILLKGQTIMMGYIDNEKANASAFTPGAWFKTGDEVRIDPDGQLFYVDRLAEVFKNRALQVAPSEIAALIRHSLPDLVQDCLVIGMPAPRDRAKNGDEAWAFVVLTPAAAAKVKKGGIRRVEEDKVRQRVKDVVKGNLARHKWVEEVRFVKGFPQVRRTRVSHDTIVELLPTGPTGKIFVRQMKAEVLKEEQAWRRDAKL